MTPICLVLVERANHLLDLKCNEPALRNGEEMRNFQGIRKGIGKTRGSACHPEAQPKDLYRIYKSFRDPSLRSG
jgi:hypothetical protein